MIDAILVHRAADFIGDGFQLGRAILHSHTGAHSLQHFPVVVAGGVSARSDVAGLKAAGAAGAVLGSALYSGKIKLVDALEECR